MEWKDSPIFPDRYEVSTTGLVRSKSYIKTVARNGKLVQWLTKPQILAAAVTKNGYYQVSLQCDGKAISKTVHSLVALIFVKGYIEGLEVNHKDSNRLNNHFSNLEWVTRQDNVIHSYNDGLNSNAKDKHPRAVLSSELVNCMRKDYLEGLSYKVIAIKYNKLYTTVWSALNGRNWKDLK